MRRAIFKRGDGSPVILTLSLPNAVAEEEAEERGALAINGFYSVLSAEYISSLKKQIAAQTVSEATRRAVYVNVSFEVAEEKKRKSRPRISFIRRCTVTGKGREAEVRCERDSFDLSRGLLVK